MKFSLAGVSATLSLIMAAGMAGTFFGFSTGVMPGLNAARPASAIDAMQGINQRIQNPLFVAMFLLVPVLAAAAGCCCSPWTRSRRPCSSSPRLACTSWARSSRASR
ncbi:hypothetical protein ACFQY7_12160 [Actinomadura luteofluorescens]|uniref:hypothetical protein n=1 Tax=Actinomadura luteofluorescens TaxID=46163 RepID=UPI0036431A72